MVTENGWGLQGLKFLRASLFDARGLLEWLPYNGKGFPKVSKPAQRYRGRTVL